MGRIIFAEYYLQQNITQVNTIICRQQLGLLQLARYTMFFSFCNSFVVVVALVIQFPNSTF